MNRRIMIEVRRDDDLTHPYQVFGDDYRGRHTVGDGDTEAEALGDWLRKAAWRPEMDPGHRRASWARHVGVEREHAGWANVETWAVQQMIRNNETLNAIVRDFCRSRESRANPGMALREFILPMMCDNLEPAEPDEKADPAKVTMANLAQMLAAYAVDQVDWSALHSSFAAR